MGCVKFQIHGEDRDFLKKNDHIWDARKSRKNYEQEKKVCLFFSMFLSIFRQDDYFTPHKR